MTQDGTHDPRSKPTSSCRKKPRARAQRGAEGIGLYRSEFLLAGTTAAGLDEDAQYDVYRRLIDGMSGGRVTVRTFDVTEAQLGLGARQAVTIAPPLGLRGLRLSLSFDEVFQAQLRALLRAAVHGPLRIMFPFVTGVEEVRLARAAVATARRDRCGRAASRRRRRADRHHDRGAVGGADVDLLADEADFFSIGTNDLIQYCLAVDRTDDRVSGHVRAAAPGDPARAAPGGARRAPTPDVPVSVCGEMAADPVLLPLLAGLGLREFSMTPAAIPAGEAGRPRPAASPRRSRLASRALKAATADRRRADAGGVPVAGADELRLTRPCHAEERE